MRKTAKQWDEVMSDRENRGPDSGFEVIKPPDTLSARVKLNGPNAVKTEGLEMSDDGFIEKVAANYLEYFKKDLKMLSTAFVQLSKSPENKEAREAVFNASHDIKGQAGSFGYILITDIANHLCRFLEKVDVIEKKHLDVIGFHVEAMKIAEAKNMKGNGGPAGQKLLDGLKGVVAKLGAT